MTEKQLEPRKHPPNPELVNLLAPRPAQLAPILDSSSEFS